MPFISAIPLRATKLVLRFPTPLDGWRCTTPHLADTGIMSPPSVFSRSRRATDSAEPVKWPGEAGRVVPHMDESRSYRVERRVAEGG